MQLSPNPLIIFIKRSCSFKYSMSKKMIFFKGKSFQISKWTSNSYFFFVKKEEFLITALFGVGLCVFIGLETFTSSNSFTFFVLVAGTDIDCSSKFVL